MKKLFHKKDLKKIARKYGLRFVILHGSFATGINRPDSDIDIAVLAKPDLSFKKELKLMAEFSRAVLTYDHELDVKTLNRVDPLFRYEVVRDGILLYGDPDDYEDFKAFTRHAYVDAEPLFQLENILIEKTQKRLLKGYGSV